MRCESVAWVTERRDVLSAYFYMTSVLAYLRYCEAIHGNGRFVWYGVMLATYVLGLLSKASGITLPLVLLDLDVWPLRRLDGAPAPRRAASFLVEKVPLFVLAVLFMIIAALAQA